MSDVLSTTFNLYLLYVCLAYIAAIIIASQTSDFLLRPLQVVEVGETGNFQAVFDGCHVDSFVLERLR